MSNQYSYTPTTPANGAQFASILSSASFDQSQPGTPTAGRGRPRGSAIGAKRGRKPRGASVAGASSPRPFVANTFAGSSPTMTPTTFASSSTATPTQYSRVHWASNTTAGTSGDTPVSESLNGESSATNIIDSSAVPTADQPRTSTPQPVIDPALIGVSGSRRGTPALDGPSGLQLPGSAISQQPLGRVGTMVGEDDGEQDDELLPAMADDDYSAQLSFQSQSKDNLKVLMDNFSPAQYDRFEAYRRHALPKQAVRKVIQQTLGHQVSQPVAQIIAGFSKVFVGEIVEKARAVQARRGEIGPLSPDHLREAYRAYQQETGHVGAARPLRSKKLFVR
ncbi:hypothetical protein CVT24_011885 [Panaeolus cyanescens]|uniref:Transcription initiation factor TFIID subunit 11 n=1 Tax=Panaeolus cyanescens TaxID=181874 RepID=A0A409YNP3_9AGAR|nr:hypothetical protein CVT24_011885 [Panaeolus cyanescens]